MPQVLIVDDSRVVRTRLANFFNTQGIEIGGEATNGAEAIELYRHIKPDFVTMDIIMPGIDGIQATEQIIKEDPDAKIIMVSAEGQEKMVFDSIQKGAMNFLVKPFSTEQLRKIITNILYSKNPDPEDDINLSEALVLAIDDSKTALALLQKHFKDFGYNLITASDGRTGLEFARSGNPDLILLDLEMPEMNGYEVMEELKANNITMTIPVIIISSHTQKEYIENALQYGIIDYISKNTDKQILKKKIETALRYSSYSKKKHMADSNRFLTVVRHENQAILHFKKSLSMAEAVQQHNDTFNSVFIKETLEDLLIIDLCALPEITVKDIEQFVSILKHFDGRKVYIVAGRHYGTIIKREDFSKDVQFFITRGDLVLYLASLKESSKE